MTFVDKENYFTHPYLQGETSFLEDKGNDSFLLELPSISQSPSFEATISPSLTPILSTIKPFSSSPMSLTKESPVHNSTLTATGMLKKK